MDNSEYMRNSDYTPTRLEAQQDAAGVISNSKINSNPENTVGVLSMAGKGVELLVSPTEDSGKILACFGQVRPEGKLNFSAGVQVAQLALKHRKNKNGGQRLVIFVGSPITEDVNALQKVGKLLKKNNVAVNVVSMGELDDNNEKLTEFINAVNSNDNSSFVVVPPGVLPQDAIMSSPIMEGGVGVASGEQAWACPVEQTTSVSMSRWTRNWPWLCVYQWRKLALRQLLLKEQQKVGGWQPQSQKRRSMPHLLVGQQLWMRKMKTL